MFIFVICLLSRFISGFSIERGFVGYLCFFFVRLRFFFYFGFRRYIFLFFRFLYVLEIFLLLICMGNGYVECVFVVVWFFDVVFEGVIYLKKKVKGIELKVLVVVLILWYVL